MKEGTATFAPPPPTLPERYQEALAEALAGLQGRPDLLAVLLAGSVVRGTGGPTSDLDLYCLVARPARQRRLLITANRVPVELFFNPAGQIRRYLAREQLSNGPSTAAMLTEGRVLFDCSEGVLQSLQAEAAMLADGPDPLLGNDRALAVYRLRDLCDDALDAGSEPALAEGLLAAVHLHYALRGHWRPKMKDVPADLARWDPEAADLLAAYSQTPSASALRALAGHVLAGEGGLAVASWEGPTEPL